MTKKYKVHMSEDGVARKCEAEKVQCRLEHYNTIEEAQVAYEQKMSQQGSGTLSKKNTVSPSSTQRQAYKKYSSFSTFGGKFFASVENVKTSVGDVLKSFSKGGYLPDNVGVNSLGKVDDDTVRADLRGISDKDISAFVEKKYKGKKANDSRYHKAAKKGVLAVASLAMVSGLAACGTDNPSSSSSENLGPEGVVSSLENAESINLNSPHS